MPQDSSGPNLYGITKQNSSRSGSELWGKNQFNSTFPLSLCLYMRDQQLSPISIRMRDGKIFADDNAWTMQEIIGENHQSPYYEFEHSFKPYANLSRKNKIDNIDLVISINGVPSIPLEVKLTVVPDSGTSRKPENKWAPEMVMRPVSSAHAMMGVASSLRHPKNSRIKFKVIKALKPAYNKVSSWDSEAEIIKYADLIHNALQNTLIISESIQKPFLLQPIWRTKGQSLELCEKCFDVFAWSDIAIMGIPVQEYTTAGRMTRTFREIARHVRSLYDVLRAGDYDYSGIYKGMSHGNQTDKSFAIGGNVSIKYLKHERLLCPILPRTALKKIILKGGESQLKPERRFDAAVQAHMIQQKMIQQKTP